MSKNKIFTTVEMRAQGVEHVKFSGDLKTDEYELLWDLLEIVWQPSLEYKEANQEALKKIKQIVSEYNSHIERID